MGNVVRLLYLGVDALGEGSFVFVGFDGMQEEGSRARSVGRTSLYS